MKQNIQFHKKIVNEFYRFYSGLYTAGYGVYFSNLEDSNFFK